MSYLLRVELPDVPGSLGQVATAIGIAGGNIDAVEIVEHRADGKVIDDVFLTPVDGTMPDSIVSACTELEGVRVIWISRYAAGTQLFLDLEIVEEMTHTAPHAVAILVDALPTAFRVDWAAHLRRERDGIAVVRGTAAAPEEIPPEVSWPHELTRGRRMVLPEPYDDNLVVALPLREGEMIVVCRRGGPWILDSEIARLSHLAALASMISGGALANG